MLITTIVVIMVAVLLVFLLIFYYRRSKTVPHWERLSLDGLHQITGQSWDPNFYYYRPWFDSGTGSQPGYREYLGVMEVTSRTVLSSTVVFPSGAYWEYTAYRYPSWELATSIPLATELTFSGIPGDSTALPRGPTFLLLRSTHPLTASSLSYTTRREAPVIATNLRQEENLYPEIETVFRQYQSDLETYSYRFREGLQSVEMEVTPASGLTRVETATVEAWPREAVVVISPLREPHSFEVEGLVLQAEQVQGSLRTRVYTPTADRPATVTLREYLYALHPSSVILPFYVYLFSPSPSSEGRVR